MVEQLAACARQLLEGAPGGEAQRAANDWLMRFQPREEAWDAALQLLQAPPRDVSTGRALPAAELVAAQILRLKIRHEWARAAAERKQLVRDVLLQLLGHACVHGEALSPASFRVACAAVADIVVQSYKEWPTWKADARVIVEASFAANSSRGAVMLMEVLGSIPVQIVSRSRTWEEAESQQAVATFQLECSDVVSAVRTMLTSVPDAQLGALRCLESWIAGSIPAYEGFGVTAMHLHESQLIDSLFAAATSNHEDQVQLASGILHDAFMYSTGSASDARLIQAVQHAGSRLVEMHALLLPSAESSAATDPAVKELRTSISRGLSQIACALAMNHARALLSRHGSVGLEAKFSVRFLDFLLACSTHEDVEVVLPTLEVWFFFLDGRLSQTELSWHMLDHDARSHALDVLGRLVNALISHCKYPQWFVDSLRVSTDEPELETVNNLRREIADTLLSLFSKWPGSNGEPGGDYVSCVEGIAKILQQSSDVGMVAAVLYLLDAMIELFDIESSDSESDEDQPLAAQTSSEGIQVLQGVLNDCHRLPTHPLVIEGLARYLRSLSSTLVLPGQTVLHSSLTISKGLGSVQAFQAALQSLTHSSYHIMKYTTVAERLPLLQALLHYCKAVPEGVTLGAKGELLNVTFRIADGISDSEFGAFCSSILSSLTERTQSEHAAEACSAIFLLGRAISGVQSDVNGQQLIRQVWPPVDVALARHHATPACRSYGPRFFLDILDSVGDAMLTSLQGRVLDACLGWYAHEVSPDILKCCGKIIQKQDGNEAFVHPTQHIVSSLLGMFRLKLHDEPANDLVVGKHSMDMFLRASQNAELLAPEVDQFLTMARHALRAFPRALASSPAEGEPTLYWSCLRLAATLLEIDHQVQEMCDAACDFLLDALSTRAGVCLPEAEPFAVPIVRNVLAFLHPARASHYRQRNLWEFLFQLLHSPRIPAPVRATFLSAVASVATTDAGLQSLLPPAVRVNLSNELSHRTSRHRFRQHLAYVAAQTRVPGE